MKHLALALAVALGALSGLGAGCDAEEDSFSGIAQCEDHPDWDYFAAQTYGQRCDDSWEECNSCPEDSACIGDLVSGSAVFSGTATCARQCETDADCGSMNYGVANGEVTAETWTCRSGLCEGQIDDSSQSLSECDRCRDTCRGQGSWCSCEDECG